MHDSEKRSVEAIKKATTRCGHSAGFLHFASFSILIVHRHFEDMKSFCDISLPNGTYATPKVTKYQKCNFIIQIHQFTIKIDKINISLLFECVKIVEFNFDFHVFHVRYQEARFLNRDACFFKSRRETTIFDQFCFREGLNPKNLPCSMTKSRPFLHIPALPR